MNKVTINQLKDALSRKDAPIFKGELNLTLVGIRSKDSDANTFNDLLCVLYEKNGKAQLDQFPITTDPGLYYREHPINVAGTAILKPGHYKGCWQIGAHQGKYLALVQRGLMTVYRDRNKDAHLDKANEQTGYFGINLHRAGANGHTLRTDKVSAGCQVFANSEDFDTFMTLAQRAAAKQGNSFSYTLLDEADLCVAIKEEPAHA
ncbi:MAG: hypothetical protein WAW41_10390 [Methylobacter sp.]